MRRFADLFALTALMATNAIRAMHQALATAEMPWDVFKLTGCAE